MEAALQEILPLLTQSSTDCNEKRVSNGAQHAVSLPGSLLAVPSSLVSFIASSSALRDWLKLFVLGGTVETCRRTLFWLYRRAVNALMITATFEQDDDCYDWMMVWLSKQPSWREAREVQVSTRSFGLKGEVVTVPGEAVDASALVNHSRPLSYLPSASTTHVLWYPADAPWHARRRISVTRVQRNKGGYYGGTEESLELRILTRSHTALNRLLLDAKRTHLAEQENKISIYVANNNDTWRYVASRPKRALTSIVLDPGVKDLLVGDARDFLESRDWYADRGIPFRRGYLLYGAPGCGKTSMIHSMAGELGLDVYIVSLSRAGLDDTTLGELISGLPEKCIALMEDIDAAFTSTVGARAGDENEKDGKSVPGATSTITSRVSLSGLLNALDGVGAQEGRILFATTNHYESLDPALCRPGRMDVHVEFRLASKYQARELFRHFYAPRHRSDSEERTRSVPDHRADATYGVDSGYGSVASRCGSVASSSRSWSPEPVDVACGQLHHHARQFRLEAAVADALAARFGEAIPEREFSMASLQGYLMGYKVRPQDAVENADRWVAAQRADKLAKQAKGAMQVLAGGFGMNDATDKTGPGEKIDPGEKAETNGILVSQAFHGCDTPSIQYTPTLYR
ncbi:P-loop containing nucleoside triphosphate hydrolase protein [Schizophyllum amplum]|uniref:P-loop containing nucleoside triphosphate hydrolase protein n=1 Tax=Schizophyllum amplum TaxID=97359 RepID=A0A550CYL5_9AGAR|nr:P-loop containing nucleoside triphosphate hydrolase protein [Auriculariopsis ampla]